MYCVCLNITKAMNFYRKCEGVQLVDVLSLSADVINQVMYTRERVVSSDPTVHLGGCGVACICTCYLCMFDLWQEGSYCFAATKF